MGCNADFRCQGGTRWQLLAGGIIPEREGRQICIKTPAFIVIKNGHNYFSPQYIHTCDRMGELCYNFGETGPEPNTTKSVAAILQKLGVNRNFPLKVAFGPKDFGGMSLLDKSVDQGVKQISHFMNHCFAQDLVGMMILTELWHLQLELGSGHHLLEHLTERIPYLTNCWITSMRKFMAENKIQLQVSKAKMVPLC